MRLECGDKAIVYTEEQRKAFIGNLEKICNKDQKLKKKFEKTLKSYNSVEITQKRDLILLLTCNSMFSSFGKKMSDERMSKVGQNISDSFLSSELAHTRFIYYKFNNSDIYSHLRAFSTYLYFYENIDSIDDKFF